MGRAPAPASKSHVRRSRRTAAGVAVPSRLVAARRAASSCGPIDGRSPMTCKWSAPMNLYLMSLGAGLLVGILYALIDVRSPVPAIIALLGLLGILVGEQIPPLVSAYRQQKPTTQSWPHQVRPHM